MEPRSVRPYLIALGLLWIVPAVLVVVLHVTLPDYNASGQCAGLGFGCTPTPADTVLFLGYVAALPLFLLGMLACLVIAVVQSRRDRRDRRDAGEAHRVETAGQTPAAALDVCLAQPMADNAIVGTSWVVQELGGVVTSEPKPHLAFGEDGRVSGTTGVNRLMGRYEVAGGMLTVADAATTRMAGPPEAMEQEQRLLALLDTPQAFVVTGDRLEVGDGETAALLVRRAVQPVVQPVEQPVEQPTDQPTDGPTGGPTGGPTDQPTEQQG